MRPGVAESPKGKLAYEMFKDNPTFALVSLSLDAKPKDPKQFAEKHELARTQGFQGEWRKTDPPTQYGIDGIPSTWLIGPDGKVLATIMRGRMIELAVRKALEN